MFDFPTSPTEGTLFAPSGGPLYQFKSGVWTVPSTPPVMNISDTAPVSPVPGQLWWRSSDGASFVWFDDGTSKQWVQFNISNNTPDSLLLPERVAAPTTQVDQAALYAKDVGAVTELFSRPQSSGTELQLTSKGRVKGAWVVGAPIALPTASNVLDIPLPFPDCDAIDLEILNMKTAAGPSDRLIQMMSGGVAQATGYSYAYIAGGTFGTTPGAAAGFIINSGSATTWTAYARAKLRLQTGVTWSAEMLVITSISSAAFGLLTEFGLVSLGGAASGVRIGSTNGNWAAGGSVRPFFM